jgi:trehalose 6-phosphate synthase/phosphatase
VGLIVVSNRLPVTIRHGPEGPTLSESVGGVATGLRGIQQGSGGAWIGWPGPTEQLDPRAMAEADRLLHARGCIPVHLTRAEVRGFYQGYSNGVIWPLFHYLIQQVPLRPRHWDEYERVNRRFAEAIAERWTPGDDVWIHDYQLLRVPLHLRQLCPDARIGLFLHIPFPAYEVFRLLPTRRQLLEGMLGADLVGFHTAAYSEHFTAAASRLLGVPALEEGHLDYQGRTPKVGVFPMGIDVARFEETGGESPFGAMRPVAGTLQPVKILVGIDRLDYTKGIPRRLLAFNHLLAQHPELRERVTLIQVAVPSRTGVRAYRRFRRHVDALVGRINGAYGTPGWAPVQYLYRSFSQSELIGLYRSADVMLVTPVRDGMNLVAKEFLASRIDADGVLVLSEFTGAAAELVEAVLVNPYDVEGSAEAYYRALTMPGHERQTRMRALRARVQSAPVDRWAASFLEALHAVPVPATTPADSLSPPEVVAAELAWLRQADELLLLLDYDGTLVSFAATPEQATPDEELLQLLAALAARPGTRVHLVSGRQRAVLEAWFGHLPVGLHAEHGSWSRPPQAREWERHEAVRPVPYDELLGLLKHYTALTPGSLIERKSAGLAWHFRLTEPAMGRRHAEALIAEVGRRFARESVDLLRGEQVVEFRPSGVHKGLIVTRLLRGTSPPASMVAIGDDTTDEDMFAALPAGGLSVHVGPRPSGARVRLRDVAACRAFLLGLLDGSDAAPVPSAAEFRSPGRGPSSPAGGGTR